ncbi:hypothetical protein A2U01_0062008, partial [Trifolium medium]|nr:hypothetical protein [Trifolium medium]
TKGAKRKKRGEVARATKIPRNDSGSSSHQVVDLDTADAEDSQHPSPQKKGGHTLRSRMTGPVNTIGEDPQPQGGVAEMQPESQAADNTVIPPPVAAARGNSSAWGDSFDSIAFVERNL